MATRIDGKALAAKVKAQTAEAAKSLYRRPGLAVILVGNDPASRVYVDLARQEGQAAARVRNVSARALDIPPEELVERFVRGDASRTDGGSGLGLSIASSFTEACGGDFHVETLADLFTAVVSFPLAEEP